ncbi:MAG: tetratricopeptide repeat protein [Desulfovibrio sp.]|jgi:tetratricopeptide (TPR) repeat protein|nr:tetratricopeptide repeat protein [Desulfovibrio sp.]
MPVLENSHLLPSGKAALRGASVLLCGFFAFAVPSALSAAAGAAPCAVGGDFAAAADTTDAATVQSGSAGDTAKPTAPERTEGGGPDYLPPRFLHPETLHLYYYLLLSQGLHDNEREVVFAALRGLLALDPSLPVFQDGVTILLSREEYDEAEKVAAEALRSFPDDPLLTVLSAGVYSAGGRTGAAQNLLENFLAKHPDAREVREELIRLYIKDDKYDKVKELLPDLPAADKSPEAELFRAGVLATVGRTAEARHLLREILEKKPAFVEAWMELAYLAERGKDNVEAEQAYRKVLEFMPGNREVLLRLVGLLIRAGKPDAALSALTTAEADARLFLQAAVRMADASVYKEAESLVQEAERRGASPDEAALVLSMIRQGSAKSPKAGLKPLARIKRDSPLFPAAQEQKARIYLAAGEMEAAHAAAREGRKLFPDRRELWGIEAFALARQKKTAGAEEVLKEALLRHPDDEDLLFSLGNIQDEAGKKDAALRAMEKILTVNPGNYQALNYVGYTLADRNTDLDRALALITRALEHNPEADYIVDSLAWVQYRLGRYEEAWSSIKRCIDLGGDDAVIWEHYGDIALAVGRKDDAVHGYRQAVQRDAADKRALRRKLNSLGKR